MKVTYVFIALLLFMVVAYQNCGEGFKAVDSGTFSGMSQCQLPNGKVAALAQQFSEFKNAPFLESKLVLEQSKSVEIQTSNLSVAAGAELVMTYNHKARNEGKCHGDNWLTEIALQDYEKAEHKSDQMAHLFVLDEETSKKSLADDIKADDCIIGVGRNYKHSINLMTPNDKYFLKQRHHTSIRSFDGWAKVFDGLGISKDVLVAVIDTGVDYNHEDLVNNMWMGPNGIHGKNFDPQATNPNDPMDDNKSCSGHGTHVSGLIAASWNNSVGGTGTLPQNVKIMGLRVSPPASAGNCSLTTVAIVNSIKFAVDNGADVINMSLGGNSNDAIMEQAVRDAVAKGVVVVVAAGNSNLDLVTNPFYPANYAQNVQGMLTVGATVAETRAKASFSNYDSSGNIMKITAPGTQSTADFQCYTVDKLPIACGMGLFSTAPGGYGLMQGTSMASPVAAGVAALAVGYLRSKGIASSPADVVSRMIASAASDKQVDVLRLVQQINGEAMTDPTPVQSASPTPTASPSPSQSPTPTQSPRPSPTSSPKTSPTPTPKNSPTPSPNPTAIPPCPSIN